MWWTKQQKMLLIRESQGADLNLDVKWYTTLEYKWKHKQELKTERSFQADVIGEEVDFCGTLKDR